MLKQLFTKLQKIPISVEIKHFFLIYNSTDLHVFYFLKTYFESCLIFCIQNEKKFSAKKWLNLKVNLLKTVHVKNKSILEKILIFFLQSAHSDEHIKNFKKI